MWEDLGGIAGCLEMGDGGSEAFFLVIPSSPPLSPRWLAAGRRRRRLATGGDDRRGEATGVAAGWEVDPLSVDLRLVMKERGGDPFGCLGKKKKRDLLFSLSFGRPPSPATAAETASDSSACGVVGLGKERAQPPWLLPLDQKGFEGGRCIPNHEERGIIPLCWSLHRDRPSSPAWLRPRLATT